jgi:hypothetical protein
MATTATSTAMGITTPTRTVTTHTDTSAI